MGNLLSTGRGSLKHARLRRVLTLLDKEILRTVKHTRLESTAKGVLWLFKKWYKLLARVWRWVYYFLAPDVALVLVKRHLTLFALMFLAPTVFRRVLWPLAHRWKLLRLRLTKGRVFARRYARLSRDLSKAQNYEEFKAIAGALDTLDGLDAWKKDPRSVDYDYAQVAKDCEELASLLRRCREEAKRRRKRQWKALQLKRQKEAEALRRDLAGANSAIQSHEAASHLPQLLIEPSEIQTPIEMMKKDKGKDERKSEEKNWEMKEDSKEESMEVDTDGETFVQLSPARRRSALGNRLSNSTKSMRTLFQMDVSDSECGSIPARELMEFLRSRVTRNYCGINNPNLHSVCRVGTKQLITRWNALLCSALRYVARSDHTHVSIAEKLVFLKETRHVMGRTALCLSDGGPPALGQAGAVISMCRQSLLPNIVSGSSSGAFVAAYICSHSAEEFEEHWLKRMRKNPVPYLAFGTLKPHVSFWDSLKDKLKCLWRSGYILRPNAMRLALRSSLGDITFQEAYNKTGRLLNIIVQGSDSTAEPRLLNHLTAPNVCIWSAAMASCAIPFVMRKSKLFVKKKAIHPMTGAEMSTVHPVEIGGLQFSDKTLDHDLPMERLQQLFNVDNFIVGQANPRIVPFLFHTVAAPSPLLDRLFRFLASELSMFSCSVLENLCEFRVADSLNYLSSMLSQSYVGDVTIVPHIPLKDYSKPFSNVSPQQLARFMRKSEQRTWHMLSLLHGRCSVEMCLDECISQLTTEALERQEKMVETLKTRAKKFEAPWMTPKRGNDDAKDEDSSTSSEASSSLPSSEMYSLSIKAN